MKHPYKIGIIDSGKGGAHLESLIKNTFLNKCILTVRYQPTNFESYSNVSMQRLCILCQEHIDFICQDNIPNVIIIACMTLSTNCLDFVKSIVPNSVVVLDMLTCLPYLHNNTTIFGTLNTIKSGRFNYCIEIPCGTLSTLIEKEANISEIKTDILKSVQQFNLVVTSTILLGCSHYSIVKNVFQELFNPDEVIDPIELIINQLKEIIA